ncbi:hypothetical protein Nepgr_023672 [Nepenthes gracilis]|uniref:Protein kinase domain-containing protein n=1 Tax=Nepenthes gracilis TaxID=150966 RepID=A0AAD3T3H4_NEPGR|nr:hypothetical protein Nepgr_023672 [Nepenthes gracilis]
MEGEVNLPAPPVSAKTNLIRLVNKAYPTSSSSISASSSYKSTSPDFLRNVQAAFKRHRPLGTMQSNSLMPRRILPPQREKSKGSGLDSDIAVNRRSHEVISIGLTKESVTSLGESQIDTSISPPPFSSTATTAYEKYNPFDEQRAEDKPTPCQKENDANISSCVELHCVPAADGSKMVQSALANTATSQGADDQVATGMDNLCSHMGSLALTETEWNIGSQAEPSNIANNEPKYQNLRIREMDGGMRTDGVSSFAIRRSALQDQLQHLRNFLESEVGHPMTQSSFVGSSCATTTSVHATSAPMLNATTNCSFSHQESVSCVAVGSLPDANLNSQHLGLGVGVQQSYSSSKLNSAIVTDQAAIAGQTLSSGIYAQIGVEEIKPNYVPKESNISKDPYVQDKSIKGTGHAGDASEVPLRCPSLKDSSCDVKLEPSEVGKQEKTTGNKGPSAPRKKNYDPDLFFKVNGKLYQRLGKIGSGGSSEVHKVISAECTIYALKKIKLKGRDYATAYGFCQEILYLNKLKGKSNIIQLVDYEVTDKALLEEVMNGSMNHKDGRVKDDGYIYMVLEYGEIDLAHMLLQKWKELESSYSTIDENWLRFYWQQILKAVNTIHEERIVHSDLKPANFLLVKGSLKLIDFGIAKAIMSDTTNIQRDSQVGTLSYMSPEAFMCNERDANGNIIKCGRPSDIWSLGCILYQMVFGRTPFSEYKTFWAKFKVITDPNHEIMYKPVSNPWLLDLMKKCLVWDRNERWRIPQLLQHPFLVPPISHQISTPDDKNCRAIQLIAESHANDKEALTMCYRLRQLLGEANASSQDQQCRLLLQISPFALICRNILERHFDLMPIVCKEVSCLFNTA